MNYPKISIVTPSFNQGQYLEQTIVSVIGQNYPNLEYIIIDGGSTDNSVEIIKKYEKYLKYWISEPDKGQSHAINKGFQQSSGEILAWLNSDDLYMPNILNMICKSIAKNKSGIYFGECIHFEEHSDNIQSCGSNVAILYKTSDLSISDYIIQPATFWTRETWNNVGPLRQDLHYVFDWEWFLRAKNKNISFSPLNKTCSIYRLHKSHKTSTGGTKRNSEIMEIYNEYNPRISKLYSLLLEEKIYYNFIYRLLANFNISKRYIKTNGGRIKIVKFIKYFKYTSTEINQVRGMF